MIAGATRGAGGTALGRHLGNAAANERVVPGPSRGLLSDSIADQVAELTRLGSHARTQQPLYHCHADPPASRPWGDAERLRYWTLFEAEFGLAGRPFASVLHEKDGRAHEHRVYLRVRADGSAIRLDHDHARREKLSRVMEWERGASLTRGAHNRAVAAALRTERPEVAAAMEAAGLLQGPRARAAVTPQERMQRDRTGIDPQDVARAALSAWRQSDTGTAFVVALRAQGLRLAQGHKAAVLVDAAGNAHPLARALARQAKADGGDRIPARDVAARLSGLVLPAHAPSPGNRGTTAPVICPPMEDAASGPQTGPSVAPAVTVRPHGAEQEPDAPGPARAGGADPAIPGGGGTAWPGGGSAGEARHGEGGTAADDAGAQPQDPGPGASPEAVASYSARLAAWEERKVRAYERAVAAWAASQVRKGAVGPPTHGGGGANGYLLEEQARAGGDSGRAVAPPCPGWPAGADRSAHGPAAIEVAVQRGYGSEPAGRDAAPGPGEGSADGPRPPGPDGDGLGWAPGSDGHRGDVAARTGVGGAVPGGGRDEPAPPGPAGGPGRGSRPNRAEAGRAGRHVASRRAARSLTAVAAPRAARLDALAARLRTPPSLEDLAVSMLDGADARAARVLSATPNPVLASRDPCIAGQAAVDHLLGEHRDRDAKAGAAAGLAQEAAAGRRWWTVALAAVGITTPAQQVVIRLQEAAAAAALVARVRAPERSDLEAARSRGVADARRALRAQAAWEARPDVVQALEEHRLIREVRAEVHRGDQAMLGAVLHGGVSAARRIVREREDAALIERVDPCNAENSDIMELNEAAATVLSPRFV